MKRVLLILVIPLILGQTAYPAPESSQTTRPLQESVRRAEADNARLKRELQNLRADFSDQLEAANSKIDSLTSRLDSSDLNVKNLNEQLGNRIANNEGRTVQKLSSLDSSLSRNSLVFMIGGAVVVIFTGLIYFLLRRRITLNNTDLVDKLRQTREALGEEGIKLDNKLIEVLSSKMQVSTASLAPIQSGDPELDHSLAIRVADEIVRIEKNLNVMDPETRGLKQLAGSVSRIRDNFAANGYELVEMLNRRYDPGMKVIANFRPDENLRPDEQIITRIIKPQVNYGGVMIQAAQIEVSQGE